MGKMLTAAVVTFLIYSVLTWVYYGILMADQYAVWDAAVARATEGFWPGLIAIVLLALLMSYMYPLGYSGGDALVEGARFGLMASGYIVVALLFVYNDYQVELAGTVSDIVYHVVVFTLMGAAIGKVYGGSTTATS